MPSAPTAPSAAAITRPDILQRVAAAIGASTPTPESPLDGGVKYDPKRHRLLGFLPPHLRHMHTLLTNLTAEDQKAEHVAHRARKSLNLARDMFFQAIKDNFCFSSDANVIAIGEKWQIYEEHEPENNLGDECPDSRGLAQILRAIFYRWGKGRGLSHRMR